MAVMARILMIYLMISLTALSGNAIVISDIDVDVEPTSATISWSTDVESIGSVSYSDGQQQYDQSGQQLTTQHQQVITGLNPVSAYTYEIIAIDPVNADEAKSSLQSFTTLPDTNALFITVTPLEVVGSGSFTIEGNSLTDAGITLYINDVFSGYRVADSKGEFSFNVRPRPDVQNLDIRLVAEYQGQIAEDMFGVFVDTTAPTIELAPIPSVSTTGEVEIKGNASELVELEIISLNDLQPSPKQEFKGDVEGEFTQTLILDESTTIIRLVATDRGGNQISTTKTVYVDTMPPRILYTNIRDLSPTYAPTVTVRGQVDEPNVSVRIYVNPDQVSLEPCNDGQDNDGDGLVDFLRDPGCASPSSLSEIDSTVRTACNDGVDNDDDGFIDFLSDKGCDSANDDDETNADSQNQCNDGLDNDGDGDIDFLRDKGCSSLSDNTEESEEQADYVTTRADSDGNFAKEITLRNYFDLRSFRYVEGAQAEAESDAIDDRDPRNVGQTNAQGVTYSTQGNDDQDYLIRVEAIDRVGQRDAIEETIQYATCGQGGEVAVTFGEFYPAIIQPDLVFQGIAQLSFTIDFEYTGQGGAYFTDIAFQNRELSVEDQDGYSPEQILDPSQCSVFPEGGTDTQAYVVCQLKRFPPEQARNITAAYERLEDIEQILFPLRLSFNYETVNNIGQRVPKFQETCQDVTVAVDRRVQPDDIPRGLLEGSVEVLNATIDSIDQILVPLRTVTLATTGACLASHLALFFQSARTEAACLGYSAEMRDMEIALRGAQSTSQAQEILEKLNKCKAEQEGESNNVFGTTCETCFQALASQLEVENFYSNICDRVYCPSVPSAQYYIASKGSYPSEVSACAQNLPREKFPWVNTDVSSLVPNEGCGKEYLDTWDNACLGYNLGEGSILEESQRQQNNTRTGGIQGFLNSVNNLEICRENERQEGRPLIQNNQMYLPEEQDCGPNGYRLGQPLKQELQEDPNDNTRVRVDEYGETEPAVFSVNAQTSQCVRRDNQGRVFFVPLDQDQQPAQFRRDETSQRGTVSIDSGFRDQSRALQYQPVRDGLVIGNDNQFYTVEENNGQTILRPAQGQLQYAEVGVNGQVSVSQGPNGNSLQGPGELSAPVIQDVLINPLGDFVTSLRCVCLPGIQAYLQQIRNILSAIRNCFEGILVSGEFNPGMCRAVLTQYLCDWIFRALGCFVQAVGGSDEELEERSLDADFGIAQAFTALNRGGERATSYASGRYGESSTFQALFNERKLQHAVCLAAFGYDWLPDIEATLEVEGGDLDIDTQAFVAPATRRYLSSNPFQQGEATFVYHVGYFIAAGTDLNYNVELICSQDNSCNDDEGFERGQCDCSHSLASYPQTPQQPTIAPDRQRFGTVPPENQPRSYFRFRESIRSGFVGGGQTTEGEGEIYEKVNSPYRYDKVQVTFTPTKAGVTPPAPIVVPIRAEGERPPIDCSFSIALSRFACNYNVQANGEVFFTQDPVLIGADQNQIISQNTGVQVEFGATVLYPEGTERIPKFVKMQVVDAAGVPLSTTKQSDLNQLNPGRTDQTLYLFPGGSEQLILGNTRGLISRNLNFLSGSAFVSPSMVTATTEQEMLVRVQLSGLGTEKCKFGTQSIVTGAQSIRDQAQNLQLNQACEFAGELELRNVATIDFASNSRNFQSIRNALVQDNPTPIDFYFTLEKGPTSSLRCTPGQDFAEAEILVSLHNAVPIFPNVDISVSNAQASNSPAVHYGTEQIKSIPIKLSCTSSQSSDSGCTRNILGREACECGSQVMDVTFQTLDGQPNVFKPTNVCSATPQGAKVLSVNYDSPICSRIVPDGGCWCTNDDFNPRTASSTLGVSYCTSGQECSRSDGIFRCLFDDGVQRTSPLSTITFAQGVRIITEDAGDFYVYRLRSSQSAELVLVQSPPSDFNELWVKPDLDPAAPVYLKIRANDAADYAVAQEYTPAGETRTSREFEIATLARGLALYFNDGEEVTGIPGSAPRETSTQSSSSFEALNLNDVSLRALMNQIRDEPGEFPGRMYYFYSTVDNRMVFSRTLPSLASIPFSEYIYFEPRGEENYRMWRALRYGTSGDNTYYLRIFGGESNSWREFNQDDFTVDTVDQVHIFNYMRFRSTLPSTGTTSTIGDKERALAYLNRDWSDGSNVNVQSGPRIWIMKYGGLIIYMVNTPSIKAEMFQGGQDSYDDNYIASVVKGTDKYLVTYYEHGSPNAKVTTTTYPLTKDLEEIYNEYVQ